MLFERSSKIGAATLQALQQALNNHPNIGDIRGKGLLIGIELVADKETKEPLPVSQVNAVIAACKEQGVIIGKNGATVAGFNNVLTLSPPLNIAQEDLTKIIEVVIENIHKI